MGNMGCGSLTTERDTPVYQEERTLYVYDPFSLSAAGSRLVFHMSLVSVCLHCLFSVCGHNCTKQQFFIENI